MSIPAAQTVLWNNDYLSHQFLWVDSSPLPNCSGVLGSGVEALPLPFIGWKEKALS